MTEDEAKQKWCPFVQVTVNNNGECMTNRFKYVNDPCCQCIASACMMWHKRGYCKMATGPGQNDG